MKNDLEWYFAYGAMANPVSLQRRGMTPPCSHPARLQDFELSFIPTSGYANLSPSPGSVAHGVAHQITSAQLSRLKLMEAGYELQQHVVQPYGDGAEGELSASVFIRVEQDQCDEPLLPPQRYLRVIELGLSHFGVDKAWIEALVAHPARPSRPPSQYFEVPPPPDAETLPTWTPTELMARRGSGPFHLAVGQKIIEVSIPEDAPSYKKMVETMLAGQEITLMTCLMVYNPDLPEVTGPADLTQAHSAWAEDFALETMKRVGAGFRQVARLALPGE